MEAHMKNANESRVFDIGTAHCVKPSNHTAVPKTVRTSDDGLAQVEIPEVTASERSFLDRHAN